MYNTENNYQFFMTNKKAINKKKNTIIIQRDINIYGSFNKMSMPFVI